MTFRWTRRTAVMALAATGLVATVLTAHSPAQAASRAQAIAPVVLVVDTNLTATGLTMTDALNRGSALFPLRLTAPTYTPAGSPLFSVSIQRPFYGVTAGVATLAYGTPTTGQVFQVDEAPVRFSFTKAKITAVTINGRPATYYDLGTVGKEHLVAVTWQVGTRYFDLTSNTGRSKLSITTLLKIANSIR